MPKSNGVWVADLERFGYTLSVVGKTKKECMDALSAVYIRSYGYGNQTFDMNNEEDREYYECAMEEAYCRFLPYGEVDWH